MFQSTCDELVEWIKEKDNVLSATDDLGKDLKANQALQRKHAVSWICLIFVTISPFFILRSANCLTKLVRELSAYSRFK